MDEALRLLMDVMAIPTVNGRDDEGKAAEYLCSYFQAAGLEASVDRIDRTHANVTAVLEGMSPETVIWNGHLDTVPYGAAVDWHTDPAVPTVRGDRLYGRGASDMKSGLCAMTSALCQYAKKGRRPPRTIRFIGTCDEERYGLGAKRAVQTGLMKSCRQILIGEPTGLKLGTAQKGCIWLELLVHGKTCHGAYPERGCSAVEHAWQIARGIKSYVEGFSHELLGVSTANVTQIEGGTAPNMIPETCRVLMDIRTVPGLTAEMVAEQANLSAQEQRRRSGGVLQTEINIKNNRMSIEIEESASLVQEMKQCIVDQKLETSCIGINFFTDASIMARNIPDAQVLLFGPGEPDMAHKPDEYVELEKYRSSIRILKAMIEQG